MAEGNGADVGSIYGLLVDVAKKVAQMDATLERHGALLEQLGGLLVKQDERLRHLESNMVTRTDMADLRQTVTAYHSSVVGQGLLVSELEERVRRIETHLDLPPFVHG